MKKTEKKDKKPTLYEALNTLPNPYEDPGFIDVLREKSEDAEDEKFNALQQKVTEELDEISAKNKKSRRLRTLLTIVIQVSFWAIVILVLLEVIFGVSKVQGGSMEPTLYDGDIIVYSRLAKDYERGDIIVAKSVQEDTLIVKRLIGLPGDTININRKNQLLVNGVVQNETYLSSDVTTPEDISFPITLGDNEYFVLGDNRSISKDSRNSEIGNISGSNIKGIVNHYIRKLP